MFVLDIMPNITLSIPENVYEIINRHKEIRWSEIARRAIVAFSEKIELLDDLDRQRLLQRFDDLLKNSELTQEDADIMGEQAKKSIYTALVEKLR